MPDQEMIERVADVIHRYPYFSRHECETMAVIIIKAMREPTLFMLDTAMAIVPRSEAKEVYTAMIDAVIK